jgi:glycosyltransferase involved in cell wall biosynthesis
MRRPLIAIDARKLGDLGIGTYIAGLVRELAAIDRCHDYVVLVPPGARLELPEAAQGGRIEPCAAPKYSVRELWSLPLRLWRAGADLLHSPHYVLPPLRSCPAVVTVHDLIHLRFPESLASRLGPVYARLMLRLSTRSARRILTVSEHSKRDMIELLGVEPERVRVVPNGVDERFRPLRDEKRLEAVRRHWGLPKRFALCVGNINPHKNVPRLLQAMRLVSAEEDVERVLVGESVRRDPKVQAIREALARERAVRHVPFVPHAELPAFYSLAELLVTPSLYEGFGLTPLEAMACGTPVVAARRASLPEVLGDAAEWVDPERPEDIARGVLRLCTDRPRREELAALGTERARLYSWRRSAEQTLELYTEALDG